MVWRTSQGGDYCTLGAAAHTVPPQCQQESVIENLPEDIAEEKDSNQDIFQIFPSSVDSLLVVFVTTISHNMQT